MERPRRSTRQPPKLPQTIVEEPPARVKKRKASVEVKITPAEQLKTLLESSRSPLTTIEITDIINARTWGMLSEDIQSQLKKLLPTTAFTDYRENLDLDHPSLAASTSMAVDEDLSSGVDRPDPEFTFNFFTDAHFLAAARTFQDHLYSNWFSESHNEKIRAFEEGIRNGTLSAPWKDEEWEREHPVPSSSIPTNQSIGPSSSFTMPAESGARAGGAAEVKLVTLAKAHIIRVGDLLAYKRSFATSEAVEKDCIIQSIHPTNYSITVLTQPGTVKELPTHLLANDPLDPLPDTQSMTITSPSMLETGILDLDGRMEKSRRPNGNAWKCFTIWRWRGGGEFNSYDGRGGRENHGTLFYLRGSYYHDS